MILKSFSVKNYRSIGSVTKANLGQYSVFVGPNNQGKTNLIKAIGLGMDILKRWPYLRIHRSSRTGGASDNNQVPSFYFRRYWDWEEDYPLFKRENLSPKPTEIYFEFSLDETECIEFYDYTSARCNGSLPVTIKLNSNMVTLSFPKPGRGNETYKRQAKKIANFISNKLDIVAMPAIRTAEASEPLFNDLIREKLTQLETEDEYKQLRERLETLRRNAIENINLSIGETVKKYIPSVDEIKIVPKPDNEIISLQEVIVRSGNYETSLLNQGEGIKSLITLSMIHHKSMSELGSEDGNGTSHILIIDEPESHLHPDSIHELKKLLSEISETEQVIIATHNPVFVNRTDVENNLIVEKNKARPALQISEIRKSLGVQIQDNLSSAETIILVEGLTDIKILKKAFKTYDSSGEVLKKVEEGRIVLKKTSGVSNFIKHIEYEKTTLCKILVVCDDDSAGQNKVNNMRESNIIDDKHVFIPRPGGREEGYQETEIEDTIKPEVYLSSLSNEFGRTFNENHFSNRRQKWSKNFKEACTRLAIVDNPDNEKKAKMIIAQAVESYNGDPFKPNLRQQFGQIISNI
ncbi:ATP-dependent nuclease [Rothia nasimurium]|uniref:ATP-dependent nuclease n=1 Tax=Rothia nasimurium TaxID=85336 RepID=UPI001F463730|nr:ATP-binding protein [Rothia nasimurium]